MWYVYIVTCADGSYYTGSTKNIERRVAEHNSSNTISAKYTRYRRPVILVYKEIYQSHSEALKRECEIKKLSRDKKYQLIAGA